MAHLLTVSNASVTTSVSTASFTVPVAATYCVLFAAFRGADGGDTELTTATLGAQAFTLNKGALRQFNGFQAIEAGYILAADMPSGSVTVTANRASGSNGFTVAAMFFDDAAQAIPKVTLNGYDSAPPDPVTTSVTTASDAVLVDMIATSVTGTVWTEQETGQVARGTTDDPAGDVGSEVSTRAVTGAASHAMSWDTAANSNRTTHIVLALETAGGSPALTIDSTDAAMQRSTSFDVTFSDPATAPTTGNTSLASGNDTLTCTAVTGSDPYTSQRLL